MGSNAIGIVTGARGLLGRDVCRRLVAAGASLVGLTSQVADSTNDFHVRGVKYQSVDFNSCWSEHELPSRADFIIHLAQSAQFRDFPGSALDVFRVNVESTARLLDYGRQVGIKKFIYASSGGVYGNGSQAFKENAPVIPPVQLGYYLGSKASGEILVQSYASVFQVTIVRPFFIYGPGQNRSMLIPRLFDSVASGTPVSLQGNDGIRINPVHVRDASAAVGAALSTNESAVFNIAGPEILSIREICEGMGKYMGSRPNFLFQPDKANDLVADISAMRSLLMEPKRRLLASLSDVLP